jgi:siroheme synthase
LAKPFLRKNAAVLLNEVKSRQSWYNLIEDGKTVKEKFIIGELVPIDRDKLRGLAKPFLRKNAAVLLNEVKSRQSWYNLIEDGKTVKEKFIIGELVPIDRDKLRGLAKPFLRKNAAVLLNEVKSRQSRYNLVEDGKTVKEKFIIGELAEWLNAAVLKTVKDASPSGVRIPDSPQIF